VKLFFWNAGNNKWKASEIANHIRGFDADLIGIVESGFRRKLVDTTWRPLFSDYTVEVLTHEMALITRGKTLAKESGALGGRSYFNLLEVELAGERFHVLLIDINGSPFVSRSRAFERLATMIRTYSQYNLIVMGDFNTPLGSVYFESFRPYLNDAFESGGTGFAETWPIPVPVLNIDHIWVAKKMKVTSCNLNWSWLSDHRSVMAAIAPCDN
jgi:endonuclease/exonuclease/phosphatase family metal-dependent hydrolase